MSGRHLLLDFGGPVLLSPFELHHLGAESFGVDVSAFGGGPFDAGDERWQRRIAGEITERQYWAEEAERFGLDMAGYLARFYEPSGDHLTRPESVALVEELRAAGRKVGVLTNDLTLFHGVEWQEPISVLKLVDPLVDLSHSDHPKPHPKAFAEGIAAMEEAPDEIVYVDDQVDNASAALAAGLISVFFDITDPAGSHARIRHALEGGDPS